MKSNLQKKAPAKTSSGYTLLFSVLISSIVLGVTLSILSISRKELLLSSNARESQYAFYAADTGLECASYHDLKRGIFTGGTALTVSCAGVDRTTLAPPIIDTSNPVPGQTLVKSKYVFSIPVDISNSQACAEVQVIKEELTTRVAGIPPVDTVTSTTTIDSRGYNVGWNGTDCTTVSTRKVERMLHLVR